MTNIYHDNIRKFREEYLDKTQEQLADDLGIGRSAYLNFEMGTTHLFNKNLTKLAQYSGVSEEDIILRAGQGKARAELREVSDFEAIRLELVADYEKRLKEKDEQIVGLNLKLQELESSLEDAKKTINTLRGTSNYLLSRLGE